MTAIEFKRLLKAFADHPDDIDLTRDEAIIQIQNQIIAFRVHNKNGQISIDEGGVVSSAESWVAQRLANLPLLAQRIIDYTDEEEKFVTPDGNFIDRIESSPNDEDTYVSNALSHLVKMVEVGSGISTFVVYLTAEAGEGKTTLINQLARQQAKDYLAKKTSRLVVPIQLGGRSFLRLDDMIIGSVANNYRFRGLYIESFLELVKYGFVVPAFDGFEEMFVVGSSGEAVSSLGNFLANLESMGQLIVSARTAYFEIRDFESQARLFDGLRKGEASFARLKLQRWNKPHFTEYWNLRGLQNAEVVFAALVEKLGTENHPLLTRAVLVRRLADIAADSGRFDRLLQKIGKASASYFAELVDSILDREIESKWTDRAEEGVQRPLLDIDQQHLLLSMIAVEMAVATSSQLSLEELRIVTDLFCDSQRLSPQISKQVTARIFDHPLLSKPDSNTNAICFDHEEFREFFLGEAIGQYVFTGKLGDILSLFRKSVMSESVVDACVGKLRAAGADPGKSIALLQAVIKADNAASYAKETGSKIIMRIIQQFEVRDIVVSDAYIGPEAFIGAQINSVTFQNCFYHNAILRACVLKGCRFSNCEFDEIEIHDDATIKDTKLENCVVHSVGIAGEDANIFSPETILRVLGRAGFLILGEEIGEVSEDCESSPDGLISLASRALRSFHRSTGVNESTLRLRLGKRGKEFEELVLPELLEVGVLEFDTYKGSGSDRRFRLGVKMSELENALKDSEGLLGNFIEYFRKKKANGGDSEG